MLRLPKSPNCQWVPVGGRGAWTARSARSARRARRMPIYLRLGVEGVTLDPWPPPTVASSADLRSCEGVLRPPRSAKCPYDAWLQTTKDKTREHWSTGALGQTGRRPGPTAPSGRTGNWRYPGLRALIYNCGRCSWWRRTSTAPRSAPFISSYRGPTGRGHGG